MKTVPLLSFVEAMEEKWREYDNVVSDPLRTVWAQIALAMNQQIESPSLPRPVIPAELGAGKSTSAKMYCAMMAHAFQHPGILVVVQTVEQAQEYAHDINNWSGTNTALAFWSKRAPRPSPDEIVSYPVVIICHRQYELALDEKLVDEDERYDRFTRFGHGVRRLAIIDESIEQVYIARLSQKMLHDIRGLVSPQLVKEHRAAFQLLHSVDLALMAAPANGNAVISADKLLAGTQMTVAGADLTIQRFWNDIADQIHDLDARHKAREALTALRRQLAAYRWTESERAKTDLVSSRLLLPPDAGQIFLDATSDLNSAYLGRPDQFQVRQMPQVRDYKYATYYYARVKRTGKHAMQDEGEKIATEMLDAVLDHYGDHASERRVLVVTDEKSEPRFNQIWSWGGFAELATAHWGAIDGRNTWREFDTLVMLSTNWATKTLDLARWLAIHGIELDDVGLNNQPAAVRVVRGQRVARDKAQAIGRTRVRRMVDEDGTCEPVDIFDRLGHGWAVNALDPAQVLDGLRRTLKGIQIIEWVAMTEQRTPEGRRPSARAALTQKLLAMAREMKPGERRPIEQKMFGGSNGSFYRMVEQAQQSEHALYVALAEIGARVDPGGYRDGVKGKAPAELVKK